MSLNNYLSEQLLKNARPEDIAREREKIDVALDAIRIRRAREDVNAFIEYTMQDEYGNYFSQAPIHKEWQDIIPLEGYSKTLIIGPREHGKTEQMVGRCIWEIGRNPNVRIKYVMGVDDKASSLVASIGLHVTENERVRKVFPMLKPSNKSAWTNHQLFVERDFVSKDATVEASAILSSGVSGRASLLILDDVVTRRNAVIQPGLQKQVIGQYRDVWIPTLTPNGRVVYIATPWHEKDLTSQLFRDGTWNLWRRPAIVDDKPIWPEMWNMGALEGRRSDIGERAFKQQYMLQMFAEEERLFSFSSIEISKRNDWFLGDEDYIDATWPRYMGVDLARKAGQGNFSVIFVIAIDPNGNRWIVDIFRKQIRSTELAAMIYDKYQQHNPVIVLVENNAYQQMMVDQLEQMDKSMPVVGHYTGSKKHDLDMGVPSLAVQMEKGIWRIPFAGDHEGLNHVCPICAFIEELLTYPMGDTDDTVMAMWLAETAARGGMIGRNTFLQWGAFPKTDAAQREQEKVVAQEEQAKAGD